MFSNIHADTTHDAGEIRSNVTTTGQSTSLIWPHRTNPSAVDQLFSMTAMLGFGGSLTSAYTVDSSQQATFLEPASNSTEETTVYNLATISGTPLAIETGVRTFDSSYGTLENVIEYNYLITNNGSSTISEFYAGDYFDFDIGVTFTNDRFGYDASRRMYYQYIDTGGTYVGVRVVSGEAHSAHFRQFGDAFNRSYASIADGVQDTDIELSESIDVTLTLSQQFLSFAPSDTVRFTIAVIFAEDLASLQASSDLSFARNTGVANVPDGGLGTFVPVRADSPQILGNSSSGGGGCLLKN